MRDRLRLAAVVLPPVALAVLGVTHPVDLNGADAEWWRDLHVIGLFLFPLLALAPVLLVREVQPRLAPLAVVLAYVFAACYTALDVLAGIAGGALELARVDVHGVLNRTADAIALPGVIAYLAVTVLAAVLVLPARPGLSIPGALLAVGGAVSFLNSHIFPPRGVITMLALAAGWGLLEVAARSRRGAARPGSAAGARAAASR